MPGQPSPAPGPVPQWCPTPRELDDLELLGNGALAPLTGFEGADGAVTLQVPAEVAAQARSAGELELVDPEGLPLAVVAVERTYAVDGDDGDQAGIAGPVTPLAHPEFGPFRALYRSPAEIADAEDAATLTVPVVDALTQADLDAVAAATDGRVLLLALVGAGSPTRLSAPALIRATLVAAKLLLHAGVDADVVAVPLASRGDPRSDEALRAQVLAAYAPGQVLEVTGQGELPAGVADIIRRDRPDPADQGLVVFFTGLSGSGKSTLARALHDVVLEQGGRSVTSLDGDVVRRNLSAGLGFSKVDRETNIRRIGWVAAEIGRHGGMAICSPIAPFATTREQVREMVEAAGGAFMLVHVATPLAECERRDRKGLYAKARRGEIPEFTGISSPYEEPDDAAVRVDTTGRSIADALDDVLRVLRDGGWLADERRTTDGPLRSPHAHP